MVCEAIKDVLMHGYSIFKRRNNEIERKKRIIQLKDANTAIIIFRKPQEKKKRSLKRLLQLTSKKPKIIRPSLTQALYWSLPEDSDSALIDGNSSLIGSTVHVQYVSMISIDCSIRFRSSSSSTADEKVVERVQEEQIVSLQATLTEFQTNEFEYRTISDEYEHFMLEQDDEIEKKELKIIQLKQMVEMIAFEESPKEAQKSDDLQTSLLDCTNPVFVLSADHHGHIVKTQEGLKIKKSQQREMQQQKRVYATLILQSQAATQKLQETIAAHASHVESLKAQLEVLAPELEGLQILQTKALIELDAVSERYRLASARIDEKSRLNQCRWSKWEEIILD